jgi:hypothetical protein
MVLIIVKYVEGLPALAVLTFVYNDIEWLQRNGMAKSKKSQIPLSLSSEPSTIFSSPIVKSQKRMNFSEFANSIIEPYDDGTDLKSSFSNTAPSSPINFAKPQLLNYPSGLFQEISADYGESSAKTIIDFHDFSIIEKNIKGESEDFERNDDNIVLCTNTNDISIDETTEKQNCIINVVPDESAELANTLLDVKETYQKCNTCN